MCDRLQITLSTSKTWRILKPLTNLHSTEIMTTEKINRLTSQHTDPATLLATMKKLYIPSACQP